MTRGPRVINEAVRAEIAQGAAAGFRRIHHPVAVPGRIAWRRRPVHAHVKMRQRAERLGGQEFMGAHGEGAVTLRQRHSDESVLARRLLGNCVDFLRAHAHRLFHQERIAGIEQIVSDRSHLAMAPERHDEIGTRCLEHGVVVGICRRVAHFGRALFDQRVVGILHGDQFHIRHGEEVSQIGGVVERMPVADFDRGNANGHERPLLKCACAPVTVTRCSEPGRESAAPRPAWRRDRPGLR